MGKGFKFIVLFLFSGCSTEPICSKYAYEEKLLEKMIRTEFNVEMMDKSVKETSNLAMDSLTKLQTNWDQMSEEFQEMKRETKTMTDNNEAAVVKKLENIQKERMKTLAEYDARITKCEEDDMYTVGTFYEYRVDSCFSIETTAVMEAGMKATVKSWEATNGNIFKEDDTGFWSMFSSTLIHK